MHTCTHTHTHTHTPLLLPPGLPKQGVVYNLSSPCTPLWGRGPAPAFPGVEEDPDDALLMTCQKERALHAAAYFTATQRLVITIHLRTCQDPESKLAVKAFLVRRKRCVKHKKRECVDRCTWVMPSKSIWPELQWGLTCEFKSIKSVMSSWMCLMYSLLKMWIVCEGHRRGRVIDESFLTDSGKQRYHQPVLWRWAHKKCCIQAHHDLAPPLLQVLQHQIIYFSTEW